MSDERGLPTAEDLRSARAELRHAVVAAAVVWWESGAQKKQKQRQAEAILSRAVDELVKSYVPRYTPPNG